MAVEQFLIYLRDEKRYSPHTLQSYGTDLLQFKDFLWSKFELEINEANYASIREYMVWLLGDLKASERSVARKLSTLRSYFKHELRSGNVLKDPTAKITAPKVPARLPVYVDDKKLDELLDSEDFFDDSFPSVRNKAVIELLFGTGIRLAELLSLQDKDVDFYESTIKVIGKRNKERIIPVSKTLVDQLKAYKDLKLVQNFNNKTGVLFVTDKGSDAYPKMIYRIVQRYLTLVSTQDKKSPHVLRHSYATSLLNRGADLNAIKELLGHASLAATQVYTHNSIERLKSIYKQAHPKA
ncbi:MAG: integrase [Flavobacterium sp.]|nr:MAG: integrase [Flavobacterium sp.]